MDHHWRHQSRDTSFTTHIKKRTRLFYKLSLCPPCATILRNIPYLNHDMKMSRYLENIMVTTERLDFNFVIFTITKESSFIVSKLVKLWRSETCNQFLFVKDLLRYLKEISIHLFYWNKHSDGTETLLV